MSHSVIPLSRMKILLTSILIFSVFFSSFTEQVENHTDSKQGLSVISHDMIAHESEAADASSDQDHSCVVHCDHGRMFLTSTVNIVPLRLMSKYEENYIFNYSFTYREERLRPPLQV